MNMSCLFCCAAMSAAASFADVAWETGAIQARIDAAAAAGGNHGACQVTLQGLPRQL